MTEPLVQMMAAQREAHSLETALQIEKEHNRWLESIIARGLHILMPITPPYDGTTPQTFDGMCAMIVQQAHAQAAENERLQAAVGDAEQRAKNARDLCFKEMDHAKAAETENVQLRAALQRLHEAADEVHNGGGHGDADMDELTAAIDAAYDILAAVRDA